MWILWLCITTSAGTCGVAREWTYANEAACNAAIKAARIDTGIALNAVRTTSIEVMTSQQSQVVLVCRPKL